MRKRHAAFLDGGGPVTVARAPGRLDVLGGIADYSGSVVLEATLAEATFAAVQTQNDDHIRIRSILSAEPSLASAGRVRECSLSLSTFAPPSGVLSFADAHSALMQDPKSRWAAYVAGCVYVLIASGWLAVEQTTGLNVLIDSSVPIGGGVSSSAALEVSVMTAAAAHFGLRLDGMEVARLCQIVENRVVGAPCGIMDQVTCSLGRENALLALKCQPHYVLSYEKIPPGWRFVGIDSGIKHSVGGRAYARARIGAFMGFAILKHETGRLFDGYLCNTGVELWQSLRERVPETLTGEEFDKSYGSLPDPVSTVIPDDIYNVRACAEHPILENDRVRQFLSLMNLAQNDSSSSLMSGAGALMLEAHRSYSQRAGLGSEETDILVDLAMARGPDRGIYGAKITGGGSGGTVAVLCDDSANDAIEEIRAEYAVRVGAVPLLMMGSSPGADEFGARTLAMDR